MEARHTRTVGGNTLAPHPPSQTAGRPATGPAGAEPWQPPHAPCPPPAPLQGTQASGRKRSRSPSANHGGDASAKPCHTGTMRTSLLDSPPPPANDPSAEGARSPSRGPAQGNHPAPDVGQPAALATGPERRRTLPPTEDKPQTPRKSREGGGTGAGPPTLPPLQEEQGRDSSRKRGGAQTTWNGPTSALRGDLVCVPRDLVGGLSKHTSCLVAGLPGSLRSEPCPSPASPSATPRSACL